jgi:hypothetical protein
MGKYFQGGLKPAEETARCGPCSTYTPDRSQPILLAAWFNLLCATTRLKEVSKALLLAQSLDIITTMGGLYLLPQMRETNPLPMMLGGWSQTILFKLVMAMLVVMVLEAVEKWPMVVKIIPIIAILPGVWNLFLIVFEYFA